MKEDILSKLARELTEPIESELQVVYVLVEIRKFLELEGLKPKYPSLVLYCDWAAHPKLNRTGAKHLVKRVDELWDKMVAGGLKGGNASPEHREFYGILELGQFRAELLAFLETVNLPTGIGGDDAWVNFVNYYSKVVEDCPLICESDDASLLHVDKVEITKKPGGSTFLSRDGEINMELNWRFYLKGKETALWTLELGAGAGKVSVTIPN